jgi:hypothetical protein
MHISFVFHVLRFAFSELRHKSNARVCVSGGFNPHRLLSRWRNSVDISSNILPCTWSPSQHFGSRETDAVHVVWRPSRSLASPSYLYTRLVFKFVLFSSSSSSTFRDTGNPFEKEGTQWSQTPYILLYTVWYIGVREREGKASERYDWDHWMQLVPRSNQKPIWW